MLSETTQGLNIDINNNNNNINNNNNSNSNNNKINNNNSSLKKGQLNFIDFNWTLYE